MRIILCLIILTFSSFTTTDHTIKDTKTKLIISTQNYLRRHNSPLSAHKLVEACIKYDVPVTLALAQGHLESHLGTRGQARKNYSVWGVGAWCSNAGKTRNRTRYKSYDDSIEPYVKLVSKYIAEQGYPGVLNNFSLHGLRYAQDPNYETKLRIVVKDINKTTNISKLYNKI